MDSNHFSMKSQRKKPQGNFHSVCCPIAWKQMGRNTLMASWWRSGNEMWRHHREMSTVIADSLDRSNSWANSSCGSFLQRKAPSLAVNHCSSLQAQHAGFTPCSRLPYNSKLWLKHLFLPHQRSSSGKITFTSPWKSSRGIQFWGVPIWHCHLQACRASVGAILACT